MVDVYESEQEQIEALKRWWSENAVSAVLGVVLGLSGLFGWYQWQDYQGGQQAGASAVFTELLRGVQEDNTDNAPALADQLVSDYAGTHYANLGQLAAARVAVEAGDLETAASRLQWVVDNASASHFEQVATLRLAQLALGQNQLAKAEQLLSGTFPSSYMAIAEELRGDLAVAQGDSNAARVAYDRALNAELPLQNPMRVEMKRDNLGNVDLTNTESSDS